MSRFALRPDASWTGFYGNAHGGDDREEADDLDPGEDGEASLGCTETRTRPVRTVPRWPLYRGVDLEDEHDGAEPGEDADDEPTGGWANEGD